MILYRPVSLQELELMYNDGMKAFPARLPQQPIFYPVLQLEYARQIAADWSASNGAFAGYVTQFKVEDEYIGQFEKHTVGASQHQEYWIPAAEMEEFNRQIIGLIKVVEAHFGAGFQGFIPEKFGLQGKDAVAQFTALANTYIYKRMDFYLEIRRNHKAVFLNYPFWQQYAFKNLGLREKVIQAIKEAWFAAFPKIPLPSPPRADADNQPVKQTGAPADSLANADDEDVIVEEETDAESNSWADEVHEDAPVRKQAHTPSHSSANKDEDKDIAPEEQTDSDSWADDGDVDSAPEERTVAPANSFVEAVHEDIPSIKEARTDFRIDPHHEEINAIDEPDAEALFAKGLESGLGGEYREAIDELSRVVEDDPDNVVAQTSLGVAFHRLGEEDRALSCYDAALRLDPIHAEAHYFRANILYSQGNVRGAIAGYTLAIGLKPELIEAHQKPIPQDRLTDYNPAPADMARIARPAYRILELTKALDADPEQAALFKERAAEYYRLRNYVQAIADYSSYLELQSEDADALHLRGVAYEQIEKSDQALADYQRAMTLDPQLANAYINRGVTFGKMGQYRQSIASLNEAIRLAPQNPDSYFNRGTSYFQLGDFEHAVDDFSDVIRLSPGDEAAYYWRGIGNEEAGRRSEAIDDYKQFLALSRDPIARADIVRKLDQWNADQRDNVGSQRGLPDEGPKADQAPAETIDQDRDLYGLLRALGERASHSTWLASEVECYGEKAEELYVLIDQDQAIAGRDFVSIASGIRQTVAGDFYAFDRGASAHWLLIRAWQGNGFYLEINDPGIKDRLKSHFHAVEEVEGAFPSYEGLFIASDQNAK